MSTFWQAVIFIAFLWRTFSYFWLLFKMKSWFGGHWNFQEIWIIYREVSHFPFVFSIPVNFYWFFFQLGSQSDNQSEQSLLKAWSVSLNFHCFIPNAVSNDFSAIMHYRGHPHETGRYHSAPIGDKCHLDKQLEDIRVLYRKPKGHEEEAYLLKNYI